MEVETAAFGYLSRAPVFEQRVLRPLAIRDMRRRNGERRSLPSRGGDFRSRSIDDTEEIFWGTPGTAQP